MSAKHTLTVTLAILPQRFAVCQLAPDEALPSRLLDCRFWSATRTDKELSIVLPEENVPADWKAEKGWRCLEVRGPLDFGLAGVLASLSAPLAEAEIPIFVLSTYDTDYLLVRENDLARARDVLTEHGHEIKDSK